MQSIHPTRTQPRRVHVRQLAAALLLLPATLFSNGACSSYKAPPAQRPAAQRPAPNQVSYQQPAPVARPKRPAPTNSARSVIVIHGNSGTVLHSKNANTPMPVASTQKLLMALILCEAGNMSKSVRVASSDTWVEPAKMGIRAGQVYRKDHLLKAVLVRSSNDIAACLGRDHSGSEKAFANLMTTRARQLGMVNSRFQNASGLPAANQYSTAHDLAILASHAMRFSFIRDAVSTKSMTFRFSNGTTKRLENTNKVLLRYPYCTGIKTGYTRASGKCLISAATKNGRNVIVVILGSSTKYIWNQSQSLLEWGLDV
jgi:D-alanyl-D-alanine carboxypeptidase (penicillin-binding protein 5/6)